MQLRIGTRKSVMALAQTQRIIDAIHAKVPDVTVELVKVETSGDKDVIGRLSGHGGKGGAFVRDLREKLRAGEVDLCMHSLKDMDGNEEYYQTQREFKIGAFMPRGDARDCLVAQEGKVVDDVLNHGVIGTNSVRRRAFLVSRYRKPKIVHFRGAADSRVRMLDAQEQQKTPYKGFCDPVDALVMGKAGLESIGLGHRISKVFSINEMCPAVGQGVTIAEYFHERKEVRDVLSAINDEDTAICCLAERALVRTLNGHCNAPIAGHAWLADGQLHLKAAVLSPDGKQIIQDEISTRLLRPEELGAKVGQQLLDRGAAKIILESRFFE